MISFNIIKLGLTINTLKKVKQKVCRIFLFVYCVVFSF